LLFQVLALMASPCWPVVLDLLAKNLLDGRRKPAAALHTLRLFNDIRKGLDAMAAQFPAETKYHISMPALMPPTKFVDIGADCMTKSDALAAT